MAGGGGTGWAVGHGRGAAGDGDLLGRVDGGDVACCWGGLDSGRGGSGASWAVGDAVSARGDSVELGRLDSRGDCLWGGHGKACKGSGDDE